MTKPHPFDNAIDWLEKLVDESPECRALAKEEIQRLEKLKMTLEAFSNEAEFESGEDFLSRRGRLARSAVRREQRELNRKVYERTNELKKAAHPERLRGEDVWDQVGAEFHIAGSTAKKCYKLHRDHTRPSWAELRAFEREWIEEWKKSHPKKKGAV